MSIDTIAMQAAPRRLMHSGGYSAKSLLDQHYSDEEKLGFGSTLAGPRDQKDGLYVQAFKTAIDNAAEDRIKVTTHKPAPYELYIRARNLDTGKELMLRATFSEVDKKYVALVQKIDGKSLKILKSLRAHTYKILRSQHKKLIKRLYNHIRTPDAT